MTESPTDHGTAVIVDGHREWWEPVESALTAVSVRVVAKTESYVQAARLVESLRPDLVVVDPKTHEGGADGFAWIANIRDRWPAIKTIALSSSTNTQEIELALARGASVYVIKRTPADELSAAVRQLYSRSLYLAGTFDPVVPTAAIESVGLTAREQEILTLTAEGLSNQAIARQLWVTEQTVKFHLSNIYRKIGVRNRTQASRWAHQHNMLSPTSDGRGRGELSRASARLAGASS